MVDVDSLNDAEQRLVDAVKTGSVCDFSNGREIQPNDMAGWGADRTVRAAVLKRLLTDATHWGIEASLVKVTLRGAVVSGDLSGFKGAQLCLRMDYCRFD